MRAKRIRNGLIGITLLVASTIAGLCITEWITRSYFFSRSERQEGAVHLWASYENSYLRTLDKQTGCLFTEGLVPHPFLSYVETISGQCRPSLVNNVGVLSYYDMPPERDPNFFTVLLVGGSVASGLYLGNESPPLLERYLNSQFESPTGKPFRLMGGSIGGWALPQQYFFTALFGHAVDAVVELDGYNEAVNYTVNHSIDMPNFTIFAMANQPLWAMGSIGKISLLQHFRRIIYKTPVVRDQFLPFLLWRRLLPPTSQFTGDSPFKGVEASFMPPPNWSSEKKMASAKKRYKQYLQQMASLSQALGLRYAHFLQPMLSLDKPLNEKEKGFPKLVTPELYRDIFVSASRELQASGFPSVSLTETFKNNLEAIYADQVHCLNEGPGYRILSARISTELGRLWRLRKKHSGSL